MNSETVGVLPISLKQLRAAAYVSELRNLTKSAQALNRTQTTITKSISELETMLGVVLFDRSPSGMMPNEYALALTQRVANVRSELDRAVLAYEEFVGPDKARKNLPIFQMEMSYKRLAAFLALYKVRNVTGAAELLGITKAAVYNSIREMNDLMGVELFEREPNGVAPTAYCNKLAQHLKLAFSEIRHMIDDFKAIDGVTAGKVTIGTLPYSKTYLTPNAVACLLDKYPQIKVETIGGSYMQLEVALRSGDVDFIIGAVREFDKQADLCTEVLFEDKLSVVVRPGHPLLQSQGIEIGDLLDRAWVLPNKNTPSRRLFDQFLHSQGLRLDVNAVETSSVSLARGLVLENDRLALLSKHQVQYELETGGLEILELDLDTTYRPLGLTMRRYTKPSESARLMIEEIRSTVKKLEL